MYREPAEADMGAYASRARARAEPMPETLSTAFDYRRWFAFGLRERGEAGRIRLTKLCTAAWPRGS